MSEMRPDIVAGPIDRKCSFSNCWATGVAVWASSEPPVRAAATVDDAMRRTTLDMWVASESCGAGRVVQILPHDVYAATNHDVRIDPPRRRRTRRGARVRVLRAGLRHGRRLSRGWLPPGTDAGSARRHRL